MSATIKTETSGQKGQSINGVAIGYWQRYRMNGVIMRSGYFENGVQTGEWTTYDCDGKVYKITKLKPKRE